MRSREERPIDAVTRRHGDAEKADHGAVIGFVIARNGEKDESDAAISAKGPWDRFARVTARDGPRFSR